MENLESESLINKNEKKEENINILKNDNPGNKINSEETEKEGEFSTNFEDNIDLTEEEKNLRKNYLKKVSKKEALFRSIYLGNAGIFLKLFSFLSDIIENYIDFRLITYKSDAITSITKKDLDKFNFSIKYLLLFNLIMKLYNYFYKKIFDKLSKTLIKPNIMLENFLFKKDIEFFDLYKTGELFYKINEHCDYPMFNIFEIFLKVFEYIFKIFYFGKQLFKDYFEMGLISSILTILQYSLEPYINSLYDNTDEMIAKVEMENNFKNDILANIRLIKSFGTEKKELKRINNIKYKIKEGSLFYKFINEIYQNIFIINDIIILYICGVNVITGKMDYGKLLIFEKYYADFSGGISSLKDTISSINQGIKDWVNFLQYYDIEQKIISKKNLIPENKEKNNEGLGIAFKEVSFSYPTKKNIQVIKNLNMEIKPGKNIAIVGSSGSGKSTLTNLILRFYDVDKGEILINDINIKDINLSWLRKNIGIVSQEPVLTSGTIRENILYGVDNYTEKKFIEVCKLSNVYSFATDTKQFPKQFETIVGERGIKVSGGQKQRIAIARAIMKDAKILIFDEATSALDSENEAIVQEAINNIINQKHITTIIIAHRLSTVKNASVIYVMNHGKIVEYGNHEELIAKNGEYKKLIQRQLVT